MDENQLPKPLLGLIFVLSWIAYVPIGYLYYSGYYNNKLFDAVCDGVIFNGMIIVLCSTALFLLFVQIKTVSNTLVDTVARETFGIYLLHDNMYRFYLWDRCFHIPLMFQNSIFPILALGMGILIFGVCFFVGYARERIFRYAEHLKKLSKS